MHTSCLHSSNTIVVGLKQLLKGLNMWGNSECWPSPFTKLAASSVGLAHFLVLHGLRHT